MYPRNQASPERIGIGAVVLIADGTVQTSGVSVKVKPQGTTASAGGGTISYEEGIVEYLPTQAETNYTSFVLIAYKTGCIPATVTVVTTASAVAGHAALDWGVMANKTTTNALTGTTISTAQKVDVETIKTQAVTAAAGVTFPSSIASPTNITAGTITTVTNLTNAATAGDFTATMKTSIGTAVAASAVASVTGNVGGNVTGSVGSVVGLTASNLDATISSRASATDLATVAGYLDTEIAAIKAKTDNLPASPAAVSDIPTVGAIADQVWDETLSGHAGVGSTGAALAAAGGSGDPWATALPGAYGAGTAGQIVGDYIDAAISTRATQTSVNTIDDFLDTEVAAIKAKTDNLPSDPADASDIAASFATVNASLATIAAYVDTEVAAIKAKTDLIPASPAAVGDIPTVAQIADGVWDEATAGHATAGSTGAALLAAGSAGDPWSTALPGAYSAGTAGHTVGTFLDGAISALPTALENADALLNRDMAAVADTNSRSPLNALRFLRNKWSLSGTTLTVTKENDSTSAWTAVVTTAPGADPISGSDPA